MADPDHVLNCDLTLYGKRDTDFSFRLLYALLDYAYMSISWWLIWDVALELPTGIIKCSFLRERNNTVVTVVKRLSLDKLQRIKRGTKHHVIHRDTFLVSPTRLVQALRKQRTFEPPFNIEVQHQWARLLLYDLGAMVPPPARRFMPLAESAESRRWQVRFSAHQEQNEGDADQILRCQIEREDCINGVRMTTLPIGGRLLVAPARYFMDGDEVYKMSRIPRGKCIIINNKEFEGRSKPRLGSDIDVERMEQLFSALHFDVNIGVNMSVREMKDMLAAAAEAQRYESYDCLVVIIMSHGRPGEIEGSDGEYLHLMNDVYSRFNNQNCPELKGKPKIFLVQACRGEWQDNGTPAVFDAADTSISVKNSAEKSDFVPPSDKRMPSWSDMYFAYATIPGHLAYREPDMGSWFISSVFNVFCSKACTMDLQDMMRLVEKQVTERFLDDGSRQTATTSTVAWTKKLYFNPGHFRECTLESL